MHGAGQQVQQHSSHWWLPPHAYSNLIALCIVLPLTMAMLDGPSPSLLWLCWVAVVAVPATAVRLLRHDTFHTRPSEPCACPHSVHVSCKAGSAFTILVIEKSVQAATVIILPVLHILVTRSPASHPCIHLQVSVPCPGPVHTGRDRHGAPLSLHPDQ